MTKKQKFETALQLPLEGDDRSFYSPSGLLLFQGYTRIVIGERGAYIEFDRSQFIDDNSHIDDYELWRLKSDVAYYIVRRSNCPSNVFIYDQLRTVAYADYKVGMLYVHPSLLKTDDMDVLYNENDIIKDPPAIKLNEWWSKTGE